MRFPDSNTGSFNPYEVATASHVDDFGGQVKQHVSDGD